MAGKYKSRFRFVSNTYKMNKYLKGSLVIILLAWMVIPLHAQKKGYSRGYIINNSGETVEGWVKDRSSGMFLELYQRIRFKPDDALVRKKYNPDEILAYGTGDQMYESVPLIEEASFFRFRYYVHENYDRVFLKIISSNDHLTYFHWEYIDDESNYLDYIPLFYKNGTDEMVRVTQGILGLKRNRLMEYFRDCPELVRAIENRNLQEINEVYNYYLDHCVDP